MAYVIDRPEEPSELFLAARQMAGYQLQQQFGHFNQQGLIAPQDAFRWIKAELTFPAFEHLTFAYKKSIFAVLVEMRQGDESSLTDQQRTNLIEACRENQLIPCLFSFDFDGQLHPMHPAWNLIHAETLEAIDPLELAEEGPVGMSAWELHNFAIQVVRDYLEKEGNEVLSFCDVREVNPQIWFRDAQGKECWLIVENTATNEALDAAKWQDFEQSNPQLSGMDGYYAGVRIKSRNPQVMRGDGLMVDFKGMEKIGE